MRKRAGNFRKAHPAPTETAHIPVRRPSGLPAPPAVPQGPRKARTTAKAKAKLEAEAKAKAKLEAEKQKAQAEKTKTPEETKSETKK